MTITIPEWVLWSIGAVLALLLVWFAVLGVMAAFVFRGGFRR